MRRTAANTKLFELQIMRQDAAVKAHKDMAEYEKNGFKSRGK